MTEFTKDEWKAAQQRQLLFKRHTIPMPTCPSCNNKQVQIMEYGSIGADWRCRKCRHKWHISLLEPLRK